MPQPARSHEEDEGVDHMMGSRQISVVIQVKVEDKQRSNLNDHAGLRVISLENEDECHRGWFCQCADQK